MVLDWCQLSAWRSMGFPPTITLTSSWWELLDSRQGEGWYNCTQQLKLQLSSLWVWTIRFICLFNHIVVNDVDVHIMKVGSFVSMSNSRFNGREYPRPGCYWSSLTEQILVIAPSDSTLITQDGSCVQLAMGLGNPGWTYWQHSPYVGTLVLNSMKRSILQTQL